MSDFFPRGWCDRPPFSGMLVGSREARIAHAHGRRADRLALYNNETGSLRSKMKAIKRATAGQYGRIPPNTPTSTRSRCEEAALWMNRRIT
jgi:hypothetical protein